MDKYVLVVDRVGADDYDPGYDRYFIGIKATVSEWDGGRRLSHPLVHFMDGGYVVRPQGQSIEDLKKALQAMLKACDEKPLRLVEVPPKLTLA